MPNTLPTALWRIATSRSPATIRDPDYLQSHLIGMTARFPVAQVLVRRADDQRLYVQLPSCDRCGSPLSHQPQCASGRFERLVATTLTNGEWVPIPDGLSRRSFTHEVVLVPATSARPLTADLLDPYDDARLTLWYQPVRTRTLVYAMLSVVDDGDESLDEAVRAYGWRVIAGPPLRPLLKWISAAAFPLPTIPIIGYLGRPVAQEQGLLLPNTSTTTISPSVGALSDDLEPDEALLTDNLEPDEALLTDNLEPTQSVGGGDHASAAARVLTWAIMRAGYSDLARLPQGEREVGEPPSVQSPPVAVPQRPSVSLPSAEPPDLHAALPPDLHAALPPDLLREIVADIIAKRNKNGCVTKNMILRPFRAYFRNAATAPSDEQILAWVDSVFEEPSRSDPSGDRWRHARTLRVDDIEQVVALLQSTPLTHADHDPAKNVVRRPRIVGIGGRLRQKQHGTAKPGVRTSA